MGDRVTWVKKEEGGRSYWTATFDVLTTRPGGLEGVVERSRMEHGGATVWRLYAGDTCVASGEASSPGEGRRDCEQFLSWLGPNGRASFYNHFVK